MYLVIGNGIQNESSSLHFAIENNYVDVVDLLVKSKADVNANNKVRTSVMHRKLSVV